MRTAFRVLACIGLFGIFAAGAGAQVTAPCFDNFETPGTGFDLPGWVADAPSAGGVVWKVDATPATVGAGLDPSTFPPGSPSLGSLNFNNGTDYNDASATLTKKISSPVITITPIAGSVFLDFSSAINCESGFDFGRLRVINDATSVVLVNRTWGVTGSGMNITQTAGRWATIRFDLSAVTVGVTAIRVEFEFFCDASVNAFPGWFIDSFAVGCGDVIPPSAVTLVSPPTATTVALPALLDWTDSTDTTSCGAGQILEYVVEIDDNPLFSSINLTIITNVSNATVSALAAGTWNWRVRTLDYAFNTSTSASQTFIIEPPIAPLAPDTLFVKESFIGAQNGDGGFVDPVVDEQPVFSAIYRDGNTVDNAIGVRYQVSLDPLFATFVFDSGLVGISPVLGKDNRSANLAINVNLLRDTVYYWRLQFTDASALTGPFSAPQSFKIGDDFEFGVRVGSTSHGRNRRCWVATAATGSANSAPVQSLQAWRFGTMESNGAGRMASRAYHVIGAEASTLTGRSSTIATVLGPLGSLLGGAGSLLALAGISILAIFGCSRLFGRA